MTSHIFSRTAGPRELIHPACMLIVLTLGLSSAAAQLAAPARFWIARTGLQPIPSIYEPGGVLPVDLLPDPGPTGQGEAINLTIWAQPAKDDTGAFKELQALSLNLVLSPVNPQEPAFLDIEDTIQIIGHPSRFSAKVDSSSVDPNNPDASFRTKTLEEIENGMVFDQALGIQALNLPAPGGSTGSGIGGPICESGDPVCELPSAELGPVWRVAEFSVRSLTLLGETMLHLQIGAAGMNHGTAAGFEFSNLTNVIFAPPGYDGPTYNAGPGGHRSVTFPDGQNFEVDLPEVRFRVTNDFLGDFDGDLQVDGRDFLSWQRNPSVGQLADWQRNFGRSLVSPGTTVFAVPEPKTLIVVVFALLFLPRLMRRTRQTFYRISNASAIAVLFGLMLLTPSSTTADNISWDGSTGQNFNNSSNWTNANGANRKPKAADNAIFGLSGAQNLNPIHLAGDQFVNAVRFRNVNSNVTISDQNLGQSIYVGAGGIGIDPSYGAAQAYFNSGVIVWASHNWNVENADKTLRIRAVSLNGNQLDITGSGNVSIEEGFFGPAGNIIKNGNGDFRYSSVNAPAAINLLRANSGTVTFTHTLNNLNVGTVELNGGIVRPDVPAGQSVNANGLLVTGGGTINSNGQRIVFNGALSGGGTLNKVGTGTLSLLGNPNSYTGTVVVQNGTLETFGSTLPNSIIHNGVNLSVVDGGTYSGSISGSGPLTKLAGGLLTFTGNNSYGNTAVNGGALQIGNGGTTGTLGAGATSIVAGANLTFNRSNQYSYAGMITGQGSLTKNGTGELVLSGVNGYSGGTTVQAGTLHGNSLSVQGQITNNGTVLFNQTFPGTYSGNMSGVGSLQKHGLETLTLSGSNSYHGDTTLFGGTLQLSTHNRLSDNSTVAIQSGTLNLNNFTDAIGGLSGAGTVNLGSGALTIGANGFHTNYSGVISGSGSLTKIGGGIQTLSGINTYTGGTTVNSGTLVAAANVGSAGVFAGGSQVTLNGSTLQLNGFDSLGYFSGSPILQNNGSVITTDGSASHSNLGEVRLRGATLTAVGPGSGSASGNFILNSTIFSQASDTTSTISASRISLRNSLGHQGGTFDVADGTAAIDLAISSAIVDLFSDNGRLTKNGPGTLTLNGGAVNTHTGGTVVNGGTLVLERVVDGAPFDYGVAVGNLTINLGATVQVQQYSQIKNSAAVTVNSGTLNFTGPYIDSVGALSINNGNVTGTGGIGFTLPDAITSTETSTISSLRVIPQVPSGDFHINVVNGVLTIPSGFEGSSAGQRLRKTGIGELRLPVGSSSGHDGGSQIDAGKLTIGGLHSSSVTVNANGTLGGTGTIGGSVAAPGRVAPGNSPGIPGILTINGDYMQSPTSVLEIEVGGLTPGTEHDQVRVGGIATLDGRYDFPIINGFVPQLNDEITFIDTFSGGSIAAGTRPREAFAPGLDTANPNLAFRVIASPTDVKLRFIDKGDIFFDDGTNANADWFVATGWNTDVNPEGIDSTTVGGNITGVSQRVTVNSIDPITLLPVAEVRDLMVRDDFSSITVGVDAGFKLASKVGDVTIGDRGAIELNGGELALPSTQKVDVFQSGMLSGNGTVNGTVQVGVTSGSNGAMLSPGMSTPGMEVGTLNIQGAYTQGVGGVFAVDLKSAPAGGLFDTVDIAGGTAKLGGTLQIDVSQLGSISVNDPYTLMIADARVKQFNEIEIIDPNGVADGYYFSPFYDTVPAPPGAEPVAALELGERKSIGGRWFTEGDADGDDLVNDDDARVFAAVLINNNLEGFDLGHKFAGLNLKDAFDLNKEGAGKGIVDFDDLPKFLEKYRPSPGFSLEAAYARFARIYQQVASGQVPEPGACILLALSLWPFALGRIRLH